MCVCVCVGVCVGVCGCGWVGEWSSLKSVCIDLSPLQYEKKAGLPNLNTSYTIGMLSVRPIKWSQKHSNWSKLVIIAR